MSRSKKQNVFFFSTVNETNKKNVPRARLLENQMIPDDETKASYSVGDITFNVESPHELRSSQPIGAIFSATSMRLCGKNKNYYKAENVSAQPDWTKEISKAYEDYKKGKTPRITEPKSTTSAVSLEVCQGSLIDTLLNKFQCPTPESHGYYVDPLNWMRIILNFHHKNNLLLTGPSGIAKTEIVFLLASITGVEISDFDMGAKIDTISTLIGNHRHNSSKGGSYFERSQFSYAIERPGIILLDEVSRANTTSNNILFPVLDKRRTLTLDIAMGEEQKIKVNDGVCFVATANIGSEYTGTTSLDPAFTGRFRVVTIDYMPDDAEIKILKLRKACDNKEGEIIVKVANHLRQLNREGELSTAVSVRNTLDAAEMVSGGLSLNHSLELAFLPVYMREEREAVLDVLSSF